jgi:hypothetical protein
MLQSEYKACYVFRNISLKHVKEAEPSEKEL